MTTKKDLQNKVQEIMELLLKPVNYHRINNHETADLYEKKLQAISVKCGSLTVMIEHSNIE